jgi:uncharacterized protein YkwD
MSAAARFRYTLVAGATAVVIGSGFTVAGLTRDAEAETTVPSAAEQALPTAAPATSTDPAAKSLLADLEASASAAASTSPSASVTPTPSATVKPSPTRAKKTAQATRKPSRTPSSKPATTAPETSGSVVDQVLAHINAARKDEGLGALTLDSSLSKASALHNQLMIDGCGLSHQCSGEAGLGDRFTAQGVKWSSAGENIGFGSSGSSDSAKVNAANGLTDSMLAETPPNDGHRKNLLNPSFKRIGLSVVRDSKGVTWMTQDFVG